MKVVQSFYKGRHKAGLVHRLPYALNFRIFANYFLTARATLHTIRADSGARSCQT